MLGDKLCLHACFSSLIWFDPWANLNNWYQIKQGQRFEAMLAPGRRPVLAPLGGGPGEDGKHAVASETMGIRCLAEQHGGGGTKLSSARWWMRMIVDGRGGAKVRCQESYQDRHPGEYVSWSHGCASWHIESVIRRYVQVLICVRIHCSWSVSRRRVFGARCHRGLRVCAKTSVSQRGDAPYSGTRTSKGESLKWGSVSTWDDVVTIVGMCCVRGGRWCPSGSVTGILVHTLSWFITSWIYNKWRLEKHRRQRVVDQDYRLLALSWLVGLCPVWCYLACRVLVQRLLAEFE
jgi:hypothetical protein